MTAGRVRTRALLAAVIGLLALGAWFLGPGASISSDPGERDSLERADTVLLAPPAPADEGTRPRLVGRPRAAALPDEAKDELVSVMVSVTADDGGQGETLVEAGASAEDVKPCGLVSLGETKELIVRASAHFWRARGLGRSAAFYESAETHRRPAQGRVTLGLARGTVSIRARVVDEAGRPSSGVALRVTGLQALSATELTRDTDASGDAAWIGLVRAIATLSGVRVTTVPARAGLDADVTADVTWDADTSEGVASLVVRRMAGRLVGPGVGLVRSLQLTDATPESSRSRRGPWTISVSESGEFFVPRPEGVRRANLRASPDSGPVRRRADPAVEVFVFPRLLSMDAGERIELRTAQGCRFAGILRTARGAPVPRAHVRVRGRPTNREAWRADHADWFDEPVGGFAVTDDAGRFETGVGLPGAWIFTVWGTDDLAPPIELPDVIDVSESLRTPVVLTLP